MFRMTFNTEKPAVTPLHDLPDLVDDWPTDDWKYADVHFVYPRTNDLVRKVIDATPITGRFKRVLIDVKVQDLEPKICSCLPGWHLDGAPPHPDREPDHHHLFVMNGPLTEFIAEPVVCETDLSFSKQDFANILRQIPRDVKVMTIAPNAVNTFTSYDFHRGVYATAPCRRLLIRLTETNTVLANNKPRRPSRGARKGVGMITDKTLIDWGFEPGEWFGVAIAEANNALKAGMDHCDIYELVKGMEPPPVEELPYRPEALPFA